MLLQWAPEQPARCMWKLPTGQSCTCSACAWQRQRTYTYSTVKAHNLHMLSCLQVAEAQSLLANSTALVVQQLQLPAKSCAVITNGRVLWVFDPREPDTATPGGPGYMLSAWVACQDLGGSLSALSSDCLPAVQCPAWAGFWT